jgi:hypothetical protein
VTFSQNIFLAMATFYGSISENRSFILIKFLHFAVNEAYCGQIPPKIYKMKPVINNMTINLLKVTF